MTYWATLWYAGAVVVQIGSEGQSLNDCRLLQTTMTIDIIQSYKDPEKIDKLKKSMFPTNEFKVTCETEILVTDEKYKK